MTFSDARVVDLVKANFIPVWESVAPVSIAVFDLGDGRAVRGTMGGEIALYFCRPDGKVFDILPALHSPHVTYWAIRNALDFYRQTGATDEAITRYHREKLAAMEAAGAGVPSPATEKEKQRLKDKQKSGDAGTRALAEMADSKAGVDYWSEDVAGFHAGDDDKGKAPAVIDRPFAKEPAPVAERAQEFRLGARAAKDAATDAEKAKRHLEEKLETKDPGTRALAVMAGSKTGIGTASPSAKPTIAGAAAIGWSPEPVVVVEPGGLELYKRRVHAALSASPPKTPTEWKEHVFVKILDQELKGGEFKYDVNTLAPISLIEE